MNNIIKKNKKKAILSEGKQIRDFVHVEDAVRQIIKLVFSRYRGGVNICTGKPMSIKNFSKKVLKKSKRKIELIFSKNKKNIFDPPFVIGVKTLDK